MSDALRVRPGGPDDVPGIARVHLAAWRVAYAADAPPGWLDAQTVRERVTSWTEHLDAGREVWVALRERALIGFCGLSAPTRDADMPDGTAEIATFYVDPAAWRTGAGRALMDAALGGLRAAGWSAVTLWVLEGNTRARAFYSVMGFTPDGGRQISARGWPPEIRLARGLQPSRGAR